MKKAVRKRKELPKFFKPKSMLPVLPDTPRLLGSDWDLEVKFHVKFDGDDAEWWLQHVRRAAGLLLVLSSLSS